MWYSAVDSPRLSIHLQRHEIGSQKRLEKPVCDWKIEIKIEGHQNDIVAKSVTKKKADLMHLIQDLRACCDFRKELQPNNVTQTAYNSSILGLMSTAIPSSNGRTDAVDKRTAKALKGLHEYDTLGTTPI
jgi:phosphopantetheine adenylyltransferase